MDPHSESFEDDEDDGALDDLLARVARVDYRARVDLLTPPNLGSDRFTLRRTLGQGGFGTVYEAHDRERQTLVALKVLHESNPGALYRFKQEFRALARLVHRNLVTLYELHSVEDRWFFTMELINDGRTFLTYLRDAAGDAPYHEEELRGALQQVAAGLITLHQAGRMHGDIKPANLLVTPQGRVVILDFGLAQEMDPEGMAYSTRGVAGTPAYMSPEQAAGRRLSPASDWYSVGLVLYEALTGTLPFSGSIMQLMEQRVSQDVPPPSTIRPGLPEDLDVLCAELLRRDAAVRADGAQVLRRLRASPSAAAERREREVLVGRQSHLRALSSALERSLREGPQVVLCEGGSGMGKTTLLQHFLEVTGQRDEQAALLAGRCNEHETVPYKGVDGAMDVLARLLRRLPQTQVTLLLPHRVGALARLFPALEQVPAVQRLSIPPALRHPDAGELRQAGAAALRELLRHLGQRGPVVLAIDDFHWADLDSVGLLADLLRPPAPPALLLIITYRGEESASSPTLRALHGALSDGAARVERLAVDELGEAAAVELARALAVPAERAAGLAAEAGGVPFLIATLAQGAEGTLEALVQRRVQALPAAARRLLMTVAAAGRPIERSQARSAAGPLAAPEPQALSLLRAERLVRVRQTDRGEELECYHERIRQALLTRGLEGKLARLPEVAGGGDHD